MIKPLTATIILIAGWVNLMAAMAWFNPIRDVLVWAGPATLVWFVVACLAAVLSVAAWANIRDRLSP